MIIRHYKPTEAYTKIDRRVITNPDLSDGAIRLYCYLCGLMNGANFSDTYLLAALKISKDTLARRKKELKDAGLILTHQIRPRVYVLYIGYSDLNATAVMEQWQKFEDYVG